MGKRGRRYSSAIGTALGPVGLRLGSIAGSTAFLGSLVALLTWSVVFVSPAAGIDQSWISGLMMASHRGLDWGSQIVFTWGPLAFLRQPFLYYGDLASAGFVYVSLLNTALAISLVWALRRSFNALVAVVLAVALLTVLPSISVPYALAAIWCLALLSPSPPSWVLPLVTYGGGAYGAIESMVRLSQGPGVLLMVAATLLVLPDRRRNLLHFAGTVAIVFIPLWFASGQSLTAFPEFVRASIEVVSGYSQAMVIEAAPKWWIPMAIVAGALLVASAAFSGSNRRTRIGAALVMGIAAFAAFKEGVVRYEAGHAEAMFATLAAYALAVPWRRRTWPLAGVIFVFIGWLGVRAIPPGINRDFDPVARVESFVEGARDLVGPGRRRAITESGRSLIMSESGLDAATLRLLEGQTVSVEPWEAGVAWAYGLDWDPLPVFQNYVAYTAYLDHRNSEDLLGADAPTRILRENMGEPDAENPWISVDGRFPAWDPPEEARTLLCNFVPLRTTHRWQVLARGPDRCGKPRLLESVEAEWNETLSVPRAGAGEVVFLRIHGAGISGLEKVRTMLFRAKPRYLVTNGAAAYRLVPGTAADGMIMSVPRPLDLPGPAFRLSPDAKTLSPQGVSGELTFDFYAMPIRPLGTQAP